MSSIDQVPNTQGDTINDEVISVSDAPQGEDIAVEGGSDGDASSSDDDSRAKRIEDTRRLLAETRANRAARDAETDKSIAEANRILENFAKTETATSDSVPTPQSAGIGARFGARSKVESLPEGKGEPAAKPSKPPSIPKAAPSKTNSNMANRVSKPGKTYKGLSKTLPEKPKRNPITWN